MANDKNKTTDAPSAANQPGIQVIAQFVKDLSFENPNAPESLVGGWASPDTNVQIFLGQRNIKDDLFECMVHFRIEAKKQKENKVCFIIDLHYGALVALKNIPAENIPPVLMVEVPKLLFPFAREIVANATANGGYPPLYLAPISFEALYISEMKRLQAEQAGKAKSN